MEKATDIGNLANNLTDKEPPTKLRIAVITAVQASSGRKVQTSATDTAWLNRSEDANLAVGDRVWMLQMGSVFIVGGRLSGEPGAVPLGAVMPFAGATAPDGWLACDGTAVSRSTYAGLFAVMGTGYGVGNGTTTFNLPDLRERAVVGAGPGRARAATGGAATVTLSTAQIPAHDHGADGDHQHSIALGPGVSQAVTGGTGDFFYANANRNVNPAGTHTHNSVGSGSSHENMPPFQVLLYCVRAI